MAEIYCSGCGQVIEVPPELSSDLQIAQIEPYYCDACEWRADSDLSIQPFSLDEYELAE